MNPLETIVAIQQWILSFWWLWLFLVFSFLAKELWLAYVQEYYKRAMRWTMLEVRVPRELRRSPRAMEQIFSSIHGLRNTPSNPKEEWWDGEVTMWFSCEVVSFGGELHFYLKVPEKHRNLIEAAFYAQYPDVDISEVSEDYIRRLPQSYAELQKQGYDLFGSELSLVKHDAYPIRTFMDFEDNEEDRQLDPISSLLELLAKIKSQEYLWVQILVRPVGDGWKKEGEEVIRELKEKAKTEFTSEKTGRVTFTERSPGEMETMKAIERCLAKPGFDTVIRYVYVSPKDMIVDTYARRGTAAAFNQYGSESLNKFQNNVKSWTRADIWHFPHFFPGKRKIARKENVYRSYRKRKMHEEHFTQQILDIKAFHWGIAAQKSRMILNTEELATIFHPPTFAVLTGPIIKRVEARRVGPPAGLPIYGQEGESEELPGMKK